MIHEDRQWVTGSRVLVLVLSFVLVSIPQLLWNLYGYRGVALVAVETLFIILAFLTIALALIQRLPGILLRLTAPIIEFSAKIASIEFKWKHPRSYLPLLVLAYLAVPYVISSELGSSHIPVWMEMTIMTVSGAAIMGIAYLFAMEQKGKSVLSRYYYIAITSVGLSFAFSFWYGSPWLPTDDLTVDLFSAHAILSGINPYIPANTVSAFSYFNYTKGGFPLNVITPITTGGYVTSLSYPDLSVLAFIPAAVLGFPPSATFIPFYILPALFAFWAYMKNGLKNLALVPAFLILLNPSYMVQIRLGYTDVLWVTFLMLSIYFYKKPKFSGFMLGMAISVKQIPWLAMPFFIYFVYRELGARKASILGGISILVFAVVNSPFLISDSYAFAKALLAPEAQNLIGIGFGPSQLSFLGIVPVSNSFFFIMFFCMLPFSLILYAVYYQKLRFAFLSFPLIIFIFNYRLLLDYLLFWPMLALLIPVLLKRDALKEDRANRHISIRLPNWARKVAVPITLAALIAVPVAYQIASPVASPAIAIQDITSVSLNGHNVSKMSVVVSLRDTNLNYSQLLFRITSEQPQINMNGFLWETSNYTLLGNGSAVMTLVPMNKFQQLQWTGSYRLIAYYGAMIGTDSFVLSSGLIQT